MRFNPKSSFSNTNRALLVSIEEEYSGCNLFLDCNGTPKSFVRVLLPSGFSIIVKELCDGELVLVELNEPIA